MRGMRRLRRRVRGVRGGGGEEGEGGLEVINMRSGSNPDREWISGRREFSILSRQAVFRGVPCGVEGGQGCSKRGRGGGRR